GEVRILPSVITANPSNCHGNCNVFRNAWDWRCAASRTGWANMPSAPLTRRAVFSRSDRSRFAELNNLFAFAARCPTASSFGGCFAFLDLAPLLDDRNKAAKR